MSLQTRAVYLSEGYTEPDGQADALLDALVDLAYDRKQAGYRPEKVQVCDAALAESLREKLVGSEIAVESIEKSFILDRTLQDAAEASRPYYPMPCGPMDTEGVTVEMMRAYAAAAVEFYRAKPWELLANDDLIVLESPDVEPGLRRLCVLGAIGEMIGLGFHESREDFERCAYDTTWDWTMRGRHWYLRFEPITGISYGDVDLWERYDLPVAGPNAYPFAVCNETRGTSNHRPGPAELAFFEGIMRALAQSTEQEFDSGRWSKKVDTFDEPMEFVFTLPDVLAPEKPRDPSQPVGHLVMERLDARLERATEGREFKTQEEYEEFFRANFAGRKIEEDFPPETSLEKAQDIVSRAYRVMGRRQIHLARQALQVDPNCADAYLLLAGRAFLHEDKRLEFCTQALQAAERTLAPEVFEKHAGDFWEVVATRPYIRARFRLAVCLNEMARLQEAAEHFRELLRLNRDDNLWARFWFWPCLLRLGKDDEVEKLLKQNKADKGSCPWDYTRALLTFRQKGDTPLAMRHLNQAIKNNDMCAKYLMHGKAFPTPTPDGCDLYFDPPAAYCAEVLAKAWHETTGAAEWLDERIGWSAIPGEDEENC